MKLYFSLNEYATYLAEICQLSQDMDFTSTEVTIPLLDELRLRFTNLTMKIPSLKSDLNDCLRDDSIEMYTKKREKLVAFEKTCSEVQTKFRSVITSGYSVISPLDLLVLFCKRFSEIQGKDASLVLSSRIKPVCDLVLKDMSTSFGVDLSPRAFEFGGFLTSKEFTFSFAFKECFGIDYQKLLRMLRERNTANVLAQRDRLLQNYSVEEVE